MDNTYLKEFVDLARTCNFLESAENMFISASTLSKHVRKMEEDLGVPLFDRSTRSVSLSRYGAILLPYAKQIADLSDQYLRDIRNAVSMADNQLNIGFLPMLARFGILEFLSEFTAQYSWITLNITEDNQLEKHLLDERYDFVLVDSKGPKNPKIEKFVLKTDHMVAIFPTGHPLAEEPFVTIDQLRDEKFILQCTTERKPTITALDFMSYCQKAGFEANVATTTRYINTIMHFVELGRGVGILYHSESQNEHHFEYSAVDIEPAIPFHICVSYLPTRIKSEAATQFLSHLRLAAENNGTE